MQERKPVRVPALAAWIGLGALTGALLQPPAQAGTEPDDGEQGEEETMIVRAARVPLPAANLGSSVTVLDRNLLERRQGAPLGDLLRSTPGIAVSRTGGIGAFTQLRMRGGESNQVLVFIDGVRANDPAQNSEFNAAHLFTDGIESVEIVRGPQSSLWGSDALSGVISVTTRRADAGAGGEAFAEGGSDGWRRIGGSAGYGDDRLHLRIAASEVHTGGDNIARTGDENDGYRNTTVNLRLGYEPAEGLQTHATLRYTDAVNEFDGVDFSTGLPADRDNETDARQVYGRLGATLDTFDGRWQHRLGYALTDTENRNSTENGFAPTGYDLNTTDARVDVFTYQTSIVVADGHVVTGAYERQQEEFSQRGPASLFGDPNHDEDMSADSFVFEYSGSITPALSLLASARNDNNSVFRNRTTGRLSAAWRVGNSAVKLRAAYGTGVKNPTFTERFGYFTSFIGNPNLKPERSRGWEAGVDAGRPGDAVNVSLTWFDEELNDEINGFVFDPATFGFTAGNEDGKSRRRGLELNGHWRPAAGLRLGFAYTWVDADEEAGGAFQREIRRPEHIAGANLDWSFLDDRASLNLNLDYNGAQDDFHFPPVPPYRERVKLDEFALLSVAASYRLAAGLTVFARVENALGENYEEVFGFATPGRAIYAGLRYRFRG